MNHEFAREYRELAYLVEDFVSSSYRRHREAVSDQPLAGGTASQLPESRAALHAPDHSNRDEARRLLEQEVLACILCPLSSGRTQAVPGVGVLDPLVMVIGEGPGAEEDRLGAPFVGPAGRYLDDWLKAIDLSREENVYITNVVKCRPPGNRDPEPAEIEACRPYLERQIQLVRPRVILAAGRVAAQFLTGSALGIGKLRGREHSCYGLPTVATYHPSGVLRNSDWRRPVWEDLKLLRSILDK
ncbi:MAG: uracil-DNA glycosylase [Spirochaetia bacterium]